MKKFIALLLALVMALGMVACGAPEKAEQPATSESEKTPETEKAPETEETVTIQFLANETPILPREFWQTVANRYHEQHPNVTVEMIYQPASNITVNEYAKTLLATGQFPDVMVMTTPSDYVSAGALLALDDQDVDIVADQYISKIDGGIYVVPYKVQVGGVWYNKDMFAEHGYEVPETWADFEKICDGFLADGIVPNVMGLKDGWAHVVPFGCIGASNLLLNDENWPAKRMAGEVSFTDPEFINVAEKFSKLMNEYNVPDKSSLTYVQSNEYFFSGKVPMYVMGSWAQGLDTTMEHDFEVGYFPIPSETGESIIPLWVNEGLSISAETEYPEVCKDFIRFFLEDETWASQFLASEQLFSPLKAPVSYEASKLHEEVVKTVEAGRGIPNMFDQVGDNAWLAGGGDLLSKAMIDIAAGGDLNKAVKNLDTEFTKLVENQNQ